MIKSIDRSHDDIDGLADKAKLARENAALRTSALQHALIIRAVLQQDGAQVMRTAALQEAASLLDRLGTTE